MPKIVLKCVNQKLKILKIHPFVTKDRQIYADYHAHLRNVTISLRTNKQSHIAIDYVGLLHIYIPLYLWHDDLCSLCAAVTQRHIHDIHACYAHGVKREVVGHEVKR